MKTLHIIAFILLAIGGINWGLIGAFHFNLVDKIFGSMPSLENIIYILVGLSALLEIFTHKSNCKHCGMENGAKAM